MTIAVIAKFSSHDLLTETHGHAWFLLSPVSWWHQADTLSWHMAVKTPEFDMYWLCMHWEIALSIFDEFPFVELLPGFYFLTTHDYSSLQLSLRSWPEATDWLRIRNMENCIHFFICVEFDSYVDLLIYMSHISYIYRYMCIDILIGGEKFLVPCKKIRQPMPAPSSICSSRDDVVFLLRFYYQELYESSPPHPKILQLFLERNNSQVL